MTLGNSLAIYSLFIDPVLQYTVAAALCNPQFLLPSVLINYLYMGEYNVMFYAKRDMVINMWLLPLGKQVLVELLNGDTRKVNIKDFYLFEKKKTRFRFGSRIEMYHGSNNYLFLSGSPHYIDHEVLNSIMKKNFINTKNVTFDVDLNKSFTWEIDQLMGSDIMRYHKKQILRFICPLSKDEKKNKVSKLMAINNIRRKLKSLNLNKNMNHNVYRRMKTYEVTKKWANFNVSKLQGSLISYNKELEGVDVYDILKLRGDDEKKFIQDQNKEQVYLDLRKKLLRRRVTIN
mmetsp:Transcript_15946/g.13922  ORF Transcript_15946/g.13922 Transcript_15946/m.13922 type:complete len:289 (-) Transcript_15946:17-883(-)